jgi:hypothetical protein
MLIWLRRGFTVAVRIAPIALRIIWVVLVANALAATFLSKGVNDECEKLGAEWTRQLLEDPRRHGLTLYEEEIRSVYGLIAWLSVIAGVIMLAHIIVWLWRMFIVWLVAAMLF